MIRVNQLTFKYGKHVALNDVTFVLKNGMIGLLGENGAGKTTLMKLMSTLQTIQTGEIELNGCKIENKNVNDIRKRIGFMPQEFGFYPSYSVFEMLEYICLLEKIPVTEIKLRIDALLELLNLEKQRSKQTKSLSGGMKRRLGLACALVNQPEILIVDEPTVGLDPEERIKIRNFLHKYAFDHTVILSTHIVEDISSICKDVVVLSQGKLLYCGNLDDIINKSPSVYRIQCPMTEIEAYEKLGVITGQDYEGDHCTATLVSKVESIENAAPIEKTLETAYMYLLKNNDMMCSSRINEVQ